MAGFTLEIELGSAAMFTSGDVADALRKLAGRLEAGDLSPETTPHGESIMDANGNTVGRWLLEAGS